MTDCVRLSVAHDLTDTKITILAIFDGQNNASRRPPKNIVIKDSLIAREPEAPCLLLTSLVDFSLVGVPNYRRSLEVCRVTFYKGSWCNYSAGVFRPSLLRLLISTLTTLRSVLPSLPYPLSTLEYHVLQPICEVRSQCQLDSLCALSVL